MEQLDVRDADILRIALGRGGELAEIYFEETRTNGVTLDAQRVERMVSGADRGVGIRVLHRQKTAYGYTNELTRAGLGALAEQVAAAARGGGGTVHPAARPMRLTSPLRVERDPGSAPPALKVQLTRRADSAARAISGRVLQVTVHYGDSRRSIECVNSLGEWSQDTRIQTLLGVTVVAAGEGRLGTGYESAGGTVGIELFDTRTPERIAETAARRALANLDGKPAPAGRMPVVLSSSAGGTMVHEAVGHGLEADLVASGLSVYEGRIGETVACPLVTVIDDATIGGSRGSFGCDDEGTPAEQTLLIDKGVLKGYLYDRLTALKLGAVSTGNGRRENYRYRPVVRMSTTLVAPGEDDPDAILRSTPTGLFVRQMGGGQVDTVSGNFVFEVTEGYLIERGEIGPPVRDATLTGNGPEVLRTIDRVGRNLGFGIGTCGKDGQNVPVADAQPTLRIPELTVGGRG